jgi:hypothetical protein
LAFFKRISWEAALRPARQATLKSAREEAPAGLSISENSWLTSAPAQVFSSRTERPSALV